MAELAALKAKVRGRVQGVFYREFVRQHADRLGLYGYVCNLPDGSVEVYAEGEKANLERLVGYLRTGSPASRVDEVVVDWPGGTGEFHDFRIRY